MTPEQYDKATPVIEKINTLEKQISLSNNINQISINWSETPASSMRKDDFLKSEFDIITDAIKLALQTKLSRHKKELESI